MEIENDRADDEQGMKRIGVPIKLQEDMFTMLFVSTLFSEYIYVLQKEDKERKKKKELLAKVVVKEANTELKGQENENKNDQGAGKDKETGEKAVQQPVHGHSSSLASQADQDLPYDWLDTFEAI